MQRPLSCATPLAQARIRAKVCSATASAFAPVAALTAIPRSAAASSVGVEADAVLGDHAQPGTGIHDADLQDPAVPDGPETRAAGVARQARRPSPRRASCRRRRSQMHRVPRRLQGEVGARHEDDGLSGSGHRGALGGRDDGRGRGHGAHSTFAPESTTLPHLTISSLRKAVNWSGEPLSTVAPSAAIFSALRHLQDLDEVGVQALDDRLGRAGLHQEAEPGARPRTPGSRTPRLSAPRARSGTRLVEVTARARSLPPLIWASAVGIDDM